MTGFQKAVYLTGKALFRLFARIYHRIEARGPVPPPPSTPTLLVANHASNLDPVYIGVVHPRILRYLAKKELFSSWISDKTLRTVNVWPIDRTGADRGALKAAVQALRDCEELLLFPEGTRTRDGSLGRGQPGAGMIAALAGARPLPVYIEGTREAMPAGAKFVRPAKVIVTFGEPFDLPVRPEGLSAKDYYQMCSDAMMERIGELRHRRLAEAAGKPGDSVQTLRHTAEQGVER